MIWALRDWGWARIVAALPDSRSTAEERKMSQRLTQHSWQSHREPPEQRDPWWNYVGTWALVFMVLALFIPMFFGR